MTRFILSVTLALLVLLTPACASAPAPDAQVTFTSGACGPVLVTTVQGIPIPGTALVADVTTSVRTVCAKAEEAAR